MAATTNIEKEMSTVALEIEEQSTLGNGQSDSCLVGQDIKDFLELETRYKVFKNEVEITVKAVETLARNMVQKVHLNAGLAAAAGHLIFFYFKSLIQSKDKVNGLEVLVMGLAMITFLCYWACKMKSMINRQFQTIMDNALTEEKGFDGVVDDLTRFFERVKYRNVIPDEEEHAIKIQNQYRTQITSIKYGTIVDLESMKGNLYRQAVSATIRMLLAVIVGGLIFSRIKMG